MSLEAWVSGGVAKSERKKKQKTDEEKRNTETMGWASLRVTDWSLVAVCWWLSAVRSMARKLSPPLSAWVGTFLSVEYMT